MEFPIERVTRSAMPRRAFLARSLTTVASLVGVTSGMSLLQACAPQAPSAPSQQSGPAAPAPAATAPAAKPAAAAPPKTEAPAKPAAAADAPIKGGRLVEAVPRDLYGFNIIRFAADSTESIVQPCLFEGLLIQSPKGELEPLLAEAMPQIAPDGLSYTFPLRKNITWSDGKPLTADDVIFTYELIYHQKNREVIAAERSLYDSIANVQAPDPYTVVFTMKRPFAPFLALGARRGILPKHVFGEMSPTEFNTSPLHDAPAVVSGAFKLVEWQKGSHIVMARNEKYYGGSSYLDEYIVKPILQTQGQVNQLKTGEVDVAIIRSPGVIDELKAVPHLKVDLAPSTNILRVVYQVDPAKKASKFFGDVSVRQALLYAIDREGILNAVYFKIGGKVQDQAWPDASWAYDPKVTPTPFDRKRAEDMLDAAGWKKGPSGVRAKDGLEMSFDILVPTTSPEYQSVAAVIQENWRDIGVDGKPRVVSADEWNKAYLTSREYDVILKAGTVRLDPDTSYLWHSRSAEVGGQNAMPYKNPTVDAWLDEAATTTEQAKRQAIYFKVQEQLLKDMPTAPLVKQDYFWVYNTRVQNMGGGGPNSVIGAWSSQDPRRLKNVWVKPA